MVRCPTCGIRLSEAARRCPNHGEVPAPPPSTQDAGAVVILPPALPGYQVGRLLGQGGFGAVFMAERVSDGAPVAIKVARADQPLASARLVSEANALLAVGPPTVPHLWTSGRLATGAEYIILEYVHAPTLAERLAEQLGPLPRDLFAVLAPEIARLVGIVHARGFIHCDLKPENIFVGPFVGLSGPHEDVAARLFDFGLARPILRQSPLSETETPTPDDDGAGTPEYMSPEQCAGRGPIDARSDVYALGVILYEMACGAPPFWGRAVEVRQSHHTRRPPPLSRRTELASDIEHLILRCLSKDPARRFATAVELQRALATALGGPVTESVPGPLPRSPVVASEARAHVSPSAPAQPVAPLRSRRSVALIFFESTGNMDSLRTTLPSLGAALAHTAGRQYALVFGPEIADNPTRAAIQAAQLFIDRGYCRRALVDLASLAIHVRPDGTLRYQSALFRRAEQYPSDADPPGVLVSPAAADLLPDLLLDALPGARPRFILRGGAEPAELTIARTSSTPLIGRDDLLAELLRAARSATAEGNPTISTVIGDPGHGKSHLAAVLVQQLQSIVPRVEVLIVRPKEVFGQLGDEATREILRGVLPLPWLAPAMPLHYIRDLLTERLGTGMAKDLSAGVAVAMGWASPDHPDIRDFAAAPGALRSAAARAAGELLRRWSRRTPLAVIIDDAQFVDDTALDALEFAALQEAACPIWICVATRPAFSLRRQGWGGRAARRQEIRLPALSPAAASELARQLLLPATNVPATVLAKLAGRTGGVPVLMVELVRGLKRNGLLRKSAKADSWYLATEELDQLPDLPLVEWLATSETASLPPELQAHARLASVLAPELTTEELEGVMHVLEREGTLDTPLDAGAGLERLVAAGLLIKHRGGRVAFRHVLLRETIYQSLPPEGRAQIHRAAHGYYQAATAMPEEDRLPRMALHAARCGLGDQASSIYLELARSAQRRHAYLDAELLYAGAVENLPKDADALQVEAAQGRGLMRFRLGRLEDGLKDLAGARARVHVAGNRKKEVELLLDESMVLDWLNDFGRSAALTAEAADGYANDVAPNQRSPLLDARIAFAQGRTLHRQQKEADAAIFFGESARVAEGLGSDGYETMMQARNLLGWAYAMTGRHDDSERAFSRNIALCESSGDMFNLTVALQNRGILSMLIKRLDRMLDDYRRMISIARENGFALAELIAQKDIGEVYLMTGDLIDAEREARRAIEVSLHALGHRSRATMSAELFLARVLVFQGRLEPARALSIDIRARQQQARADGLTESDFDPAEGLMHRMVDLACVPAGALDGQNADAPWVDLLFEARAITQQPQDTVEMLEIWGLTALRAGRVSDATHRFGEALDLSTKSADAVAARVRAHLARAQTA
jgi:eukaryotic-like serine/threonine-protein kinase